MAKPFRWISLFSGAGCGDLGLHRAGHEVVAMVEFDKAAAGVAAHNFPGIPIHCDVTKVDPADLPDADGPRYRQLGNGITAHVMEWIARRISEVVK